MKTRERESPQGRVLAYIKDPIYGGSKRKFVELLGFKQVTTNITMTGQGTASIVFPNFKSAKIRFISKEAVDGETKKEASGYAGENINTKVASNFIEKITSGDNKNYFKRIWNDMTFALADKEISSREDNKFMQYGRSRGDISKDLDASIIDMIRGSDDNKRIIGAVPFVNLFDPIFVDFKGQDGFWYAGFTGLVSQIGDSYTKSGDQSFSIQCKDLSCLLNNVSLASGWHRMSVAESKSNLRDYIYSTETNLIAARTAAYQDIFSKYDSVADIILAVIETSQDLWRLDDFDEGIGVKAFLIDYSDAYPYQGISGRRGSCQHPSAGQDDPHIAPKEFLTDYELRKEHYMYDKEGINFNGWKKILIDPLLLKLDNLFIHKVLANEIALYKDSLKSPETILNDLVAKMLAYKYFDANGNLIIELPKYNALPNLDDYGGRGSTTAIRHTSPPKEKKTDTEVRTKAPLVNKNITSTVKEGETLKTFVERIKKGYPDFTIAKLKALNGYSHNRKIFTKVTKKDGRVVYVLKKGATPIISDKQSAIAKGSLNIIKNYSIIPKSAKELSPSDIDYKWLTMNFHGKGYVLTNDDFISFNSSLDESPMITAVAIESNFPYLTIDDKIKRSTVSLHGFGSADFDMLAKLGVRRYQTQNLYNISWSSEIGSKVLSYQSAAILERINSMSDSATMQLNHRPDIQLGRTFINPLRMKSYLILGVSNSWSPGGSHVTTLTLSYGRPLYKTLETPWSALYAEPTEFGFKNGISDLENLKPVNKQGVEGTNKELEKEQLEKDKKDKK